MSGEIEGNFKGNDVSRRLFLKSSLLAGLAAGLARPSLAAVSAPTPRAGEPGSPGPIQGIRETAPDLNPEGFIGDHPSHVHEILWHKAAYLKQKGGVPAPAETAEVVIVGGGLAGLAAAHRLRDLKPVLLEQGPAFGGNAKGERWGGLTYSIGSAYISKPEEGGTLATLLTELGLGTRMRAESALEEQVLLSEERRFAGPFWTGAADPAHAADVKRIYETLVKLGEETYPAIPTPPGSPPEADARLRALDGQSFAQWAQANLSPIPAQMAELLAEYCWDSLGGTPEELSAAQVLNFLVADLTGGACALPGGNAAIAEALLERLSSELPASNLRTGCLTVDVSCLDDGAVRVAYEGPDGVLRSLRARSCIVTAPKFVARAVVEGLGHEQAAAMKKLRYRSFLVANVLLSGRLESDRFGSFRITGDVPNGDVAKDERPFTSVVFGAWAAGNSPDRSTLTLYRGFPFDSGRRELSHKGAYARMRSRFEAAIPATLAALGIDSSRVAGLRIARWGHALPLAAVGLIADGTLETAARPLAERVFFAQQDNWANPCVEATVNAALGAAEAVRRRHGLA